MSEKSAEVKNPFYVTYKNKKRIHNLNSAALINRNVQIQSSRTVNGLSNKYSNIIFDRAMETPLFERKLRKVIFPNVIDNLAESDVQHVVSVPYRKSKEEDESVLQIKSSNQFSLPDEPSAEDQTEVIFIQNNNCVHFRKPGSDLSDQYPMFYTSSNTACSPGLNRHFRAFQIQIEKAQQ